MLTRLVVRILVIALLIVLPLAHPQTVAPQSATSKRQNAGSAPPAPLDVDGWGRPAGPPQAQKAAAPAPRHDISGTWEPAGGPLDGVQFNGSKAFPEDGKADREPPYTDLGREQWQAHKPSIGSRGVVPAEANDPVLICDPQGFPRENLFQLRSTQIVQTPVKVLILYEFDQIWRVIWTDGRELPKDPEPRWFGYSVGKWVDDYTLVVQTGGIDERSWIDNVGRPHSGELRVEERFHRVGQDHLEWTVTIDDSKMYTKPWVALDKLRFYLQPANYDVREMICAPSDSAEYDKLIGNPESEPANNPKAGAQTVMPGEASASEPGKENGTRNDLATIIQSGSTNARPYKVVIRDDGSATAEIGGASSIFRIEPPRLQDFPSGTINTKRLLSLLTEIADVSEIPTGNCPKSVSFGTRTQISYAGKTSGDLQCIRIDAGDEDKVFLQTSKQLAEFVQTTLQQLKINARRIGSFQ